VGRRGKGVKAEGGVGEKEVRARENEGWSPGSAQNNAGGTMTQLFKLFFRHGTLEREK